ncbi:MAG: hypothetical protein M1828_007354 [Chrysothrix sp. TS-e1954]|nr:MAG: hypothetical protein M1828_007354 [Chrysothrix sp. TS-e1954]
MRGYVGFTKKVQRSRVCCTDEDRSASPSFMARLPASLGRSSHLFSQLPRPRYKHGRTLSSHYVAQEQVKAKKDKQATLTLAELFDPQQTVASSVSVELIDSGQESTSRRVATRIRQKLSRESKIFERLSKRAAEYHLVPKFSRLDGTHNDQLSNFESQDVEDGLDYDPDAKLLSDTDLTINDHHDVPRILKLRRNLATLSDRTPHGLQTDTADSTSESQDSTPLIGIPGLSTAEAPRLPSLTKSDTSLHWGDKASLPLKPASYKKSSKSYSKSRKGSTDVSSNEVSQKADSQRSVEISKQRSSSESSIHLYDMRISQHLRSLSSLSGGASASGRYEHTLSGTATASDTAPTFLSLPHQSRSPSGQLVEQQKSIAVYDGSADEQDPTSMSPISTAMQSVDANSRLRPRSSVSGNYGEAAAVWEKALRAHHDEHTNHSDPRRNTLMASRSLSISKRNSLSVQANVIKSQLSVPVFRRPRSDSNTSILKPIETQHSFDRLCIPGQEPPPAPAPASSPVLGGHLRSRSRSQPIPVSSRARLRNQVSLQPIQSQGSTESISNVHIRSTTKGNNGADLKHQAQPRSNSSLAAWSRYPSHTRHERSLSAGIADSVIARDFAFLGTTPQEEHEESKHVRFRRAAKVRSAILRKTVFTDLPNLFKPRTAGFRKGESGHRSSIAAGGDLEYPELELLPMNEPLAASRSTFEAPSLLNTESTSKDDRRKQTTRIISSDYSMGDSNTRDVASETETHDIDHYAQLYAQDVTDPSNALQRKETEFVPPFDGSNNFHPVDEPQSPLASARLLPSLATGQRKLKACSVADLAGAREAGRRANEKSSGENARPRLLRSSSADHMRRSTHDLYQRLDASEAGIVAKALRTAEEVWAH